MRQFSKIFSDVTKTISSSGVQFLITMFTTPIMTRLYDPSAYATFGIINTAASVLMGVGLLSLPNAYPIEKKSSARAELIHIMLVLLGGLVAVATAISITVAVTDMLYAGEHFSYRVLILFPILVLTYGIRQIMLSIATERANFSSLAMGQLVEPICARGGSIVLGALLSGRASYILLSVVIGNIAAIAIIFKMVLRDARMGLGGALTRWRSLLCPKVRPVDLFRRYADFILYSTASQQAQPLAMLGVQMGIAAFFSSHEAGHYILAISVLILPSTLIALATAPVVYRHFIEVERNDPASLARHLALTMALYLFAGAVILAPIFFFGEEIFRFVFGDIWAQAGIIASYLSVAYVGSFPMIGVQSIFRVTGRLKMQFALEVSACTIAVIAALICFKTMSFDDAMIGLSVIWFLRNVVMLSACIMVTVRFSKTLAAR